MASTFDFIVIGAGASGSVVASRLAHALYKPSVLLLEAGGLNDSGAQLSSAERFAVAFSPNSPLNWGYKTVAQQQLAGQEIDYSRGKGLGGSTAINFCAWTVGSRDDYDEWARLVGNDNFAWANVKKALKNIECMHPEIPNPKLRQYVNAKPENHGTRGPLHLTYGESWIPDLQDIFTAAEQTGLPTNADVNTGDPIGMGLASVCIYKGQRLTASDAYLANPPSNLTIVPNAGAAKIIFSGKKAIGVKTTDGRSYFAKNEVILSGGAIGSPQILMLSGVGPQKELEKHGIPVVLDLPMVGQNLQDHCFTPVGIAMKQDENSTGEGQSPSPMGWFKLPGVLASPEYDALPEFRKRFLQAPTVPHFEIATHNPPSFLNYTVPENHSYLGAISLIMNPQSRGTITLQSSNPADAPIIDPKFLSHPFDRRNMVEGVRTLLNMLSAPVFAHKTTETLGPKDMSEDAILHHARQNCRSSWHMSCTVSMGLDSENACVDSNFSVFGLEGLRVVDLSVCPFVTNNHTQSTAYVVGELAAQRLIMEYHLDEKSGVLAGRL